MEMIFIKEVLHINKRNTKQKEKVLEFLQDNVNIHLSVSDIFKGLNESIGLTTIYRIIGELTKQGNIIKKPLENEQGFCYQYSNSKKCTEKHYHLICENCNKVIHYKNKSIEKLCITISNEYDFEIKTDKLVFYGICNKCKERKVC